MADGVWRMTDDGEFVIQEPYRTWLKEAKEAATRGFNLALVEYLEPRCPYTAEQLAGAYTERVTNREEGEMVRFEEFVIEALSGDL